MAVDYFLWDEVLLLAEKKSAETSASESKMPTTVSNSKSSHDEIKEKLVAIGELLRFDSRAEVKITAGVVADAIWEEKIGNMGKVIYVFEVQSKGFIDSLILKPQKSKKQCGGSSGRCCFRRKTTRKNNPGKCRGYRRKVFAYLGFGRCLGCL